MHGSRDPTTSPFEAPIRIPSQHGFAGRSCIPTAGPAIESASHNTRCPSRTLSMTTGRLYPPHPSSEDLITASRCLSSRTRTGSTAHRAGRRSSSSIVPPAARTVRTPGYVTPDPPFRRPTPIRASTMIPSEFERRPLRPEVRARPSGRRGTAVRDPPHNPQRRPVRRRIRVPKPPALDRGPRDSLSWLARYIGGEMPWATERP